MENLDLNSYQQNLSTYIDEILAYGDKKMSLIPLNLSKTRKKKKILYLTMCAVHSYSEAIVKIITPPNIYDIAAEVLFRSLSEAFVNLNYIFNQRGEQNALVFMAYSIMDNIDYANKYKKLLSDHPNWKLEFAGMKTAAEWDKFITKLTNDIKIIEKKSKHNIPSKLPDLHSRSVMADKFYASKGKLNRDNSIENHYVSYYKFFSQTAHLTMPGLERFMDTINGVDVIKIDGGPKDYERVASMTYIIYCVILKFCLHQFDSYNRSEFSKFLRYLKNIKKH